VYSLCEVATDDVATNLAAKELLDDDRCGVVMPADAGELLPPVDVVFNMFTIECDDVAGGAIGPAAGDGGATMAVLVGTND
jgi:hypothetical protein